MRKNNGKQFQEKCLAAFRPELRKNNGKQFQEKCLAVFRPELRKNKEIEPFASIKKAARGPRGFFALSERAALGSVRQFVATFALFLS
ncbi:hypothetical protein [Mesorhizobium atlanticum]|uniref:hypothetical protein n=1 Tax=Mesorhizobium atlanticum TaxID=2233532 RepID=UPI0011BF1A4A|nr:hypothetical protein [Mesorhizobium atlanticum]